MNILRILIYNFKTLASVNLLFLALSAIYWGVHYIYLLMTFVLLNTSLMIIRTSGSSLVVYYYINKNMKNVRQRFRKGRNTVVLGLIHKMSTQKVKYMGI